MDDARNLKIKLGVVKRLNKELKSYYKEVDINQNRIEKLKAENAEPAKIRKEEEVVEESKQMIPDARKRLDTAFNELKGIVAIVASNTAITDSPDYKEANQLLIEVQIVLNTA